ncbi:MFS transporter [Pseudomonas sp. A-RE-26]|uniref:MFS transporter n=1 Tax=Pseudomonas sp. A-RE-26 TaxID=2832402 RepID=UPI001CC0127F|nr:MFS transporter [Pseudomonas sp. A-RE-26]
MKTTKINPIDKTSVYVCAGLVSGAGALLLNVLPLLFGAFAERFGLGEHQLGNLAMAMNLGFGAFGLASLLWIHRLSWRVISALSSALVVGAILFVLRNPSYQALLVIMALAGAGTGALYALAMTIFGDSSQPERAFGFKLGIETVPGALLLIVLPVAVVPVWGFEGMLITIAIAMVVMGILPLPWVPRRSERQRDAAGAQVRIASAESRTIVWLSLVASLVFLTGIMSVWAFLELMGKKTGLASDTIGMVLALGFLINAGGGFIASAIGLKVGRFMPVAVVILAELLGLVALAQFASLASYVIGVICFLFSVFDRLRAGLYLWRHGRVRPLGQARRAGRTLPVPRRGVRAGHRWVSDRGIRLLGGVGVLGCLFGGGAGHLWCGGVESPTGIPAYPGCGQRRYVRGVSE